VLAVERPFGVVGDVGPEVLHLHNVGVSEDGLAILLATEDHVDEVAGVRKDDGPVDRGEWDLELAEVGERIVKSGCDIGGWKCNIGSRGLF
jgi:hypothetical protein